ncbi:MAG: thiol-disulfide oxidoreductase DCC family protein [Thermoplasmata archaeon]
MSHALTVYFDGDCSFCTTVKIAFERLDFLRLLKFVSFRQAKNEELPVSRQGLETTMYAVSPSGVRYRGMEAAAAMMKRMPVLFLPALFLIMLNRIGVGSRLYDMISAKRYCFYPGSAGKECKTGISVK